MNMTNKGQIVCRIIREAILNNKKIVDPALIEVIETLKLIEGHKL
jgi:hypothetical protein